MFQDGGYIFEAEDSVAKQQPGGKAERQWKVNFNI